MSSKIQQCTYFSLPYSLYFMVYQYSFRHLGSDSFGTRKLEAGEQGNKMIAIAKELEALKTQTDTQPNVRLDGIWSWVPRQMQTTGQMEVKVLMQCFLDPQMWQGEYFSGN
jgi:hypothetical protein